MDDAETLYSCEEQEEDKADETLSLSAFPLQYDSTDSQSNPRRSLTDQSDDEPDLFEFLINEDLINSSGDNMCSADDIIINGKLLPSDLLLQTPPSLRRHEKFEERKIKNPVAVTDSPAKQELGKTAERLGSFENAAVDVLRKKNAAIRPRPKWQLLGVTKFPTEMELRDIRTRQLRRRQQTPATGNGDDEKLPDGTHVVRRQCGWNIGSWKVFNSLSCKKDDAASAVVANASFPPTKGRYVH